MAIVSTYLNFSGQTEEAFNFYKSVFGGEFEGAPMRYGEIPPHEEHTPVPEADQNLIMHISYQILGGHFLMGSDIPESMGFDLKEGNNIQITLHPDTREETDRLFAALSAGGKVTAELQNQFWGDYYGACTDKFGIHWMFNCGEKA